MFSYEWNDGVTNVEATFYGSWKRFHYCKAAVLKENTDNGNYTLFVSYATPIVLIREHGSFYSVFVNEIAWNCSKSTIRQLSRFLSEYEANTSYHDLKHAMERATRNRVFSVYHPLMYAKFIRCKDGNEVLERANVDMRFSSEFDVWHVMRHG